MAKRVRLEEPEKVTAESELRKKDLYFTSSKEALEFTSAGCCLINCALSGGYVLGRMVNIVGDKSTAKTALATEAIINFLRRYGPEGGRAKYSETEGAYDTAYAEAMGLPLDEVDFGDPEEPIQTVEAFAKDLEKYCNACIKDKVPGIYVLDSFDSLSDEAEMEADFDKATYGMAKAKMISTMFRKLTKKIEKARVCLVIVSQVRDNIGAMFGEKHRRAGGKALDFYATHIIWLSHIGQLSKTVKGVKRVHGVEVKANVKKNKVGFPFRQVEFNFLFGYGVDDLGASVAWLKEVKRLKDADLTESGYKKYVEGLVELDDREFNAETKRVNKVVRRVWNEIETDFIPTRRKYA